MFAAILAIRVPLFRMFGHLFVDARPASNSALEEQVLCAKTIICTRRYPLVRLVPPKYIGLFRWLSPYC
jgi:hypothetical protein